ncbi:GNAT family N-acetyltransferase [Marixanthomonas sp. SCSIO 43207]|uniref:GNAT family N-acetyltransferase n=1 Tax=Marixanthomonas sp. SCSIO 43207 TaxID=2779360 RepID=UPI001CA9E227|nr:GNAT family N-acetyltransferase [Marixanthomonas sp. SCSIO 43207]UAB81236.1 GNAT family N-acetyltransferase [Marixanthomonas sp. SCSIO 43207]
MIERLDWDSDFFGMEVGKIQNDLFSECENVNNFDLLYVFQKKDVDVHIPNYFKTYKGIYREYEKEDFISKKEIFPEIYSASNCDFNLNELYKLAWISGTESRFNKDSKISKDKFKQLYRIWIDNSLNGKIADNVLLYIENGNIEGFITYKNYQAYCQIGLFAVQTKSQGKGIGKKLLNKVENDMAILNIQKLRVPTQQDNINACAFYEKLDYKLNDKYLVQHFWKI